MNRVSVARLALWLASGESLGMTGRTVLIDGGASLKKCAQLFSHSRLLAGGQAQARRKQTGCQVNHPRALPQGLAQLAISEPYNNY
jgi:hypothetical protein